jgi:CheY-like chemotaxis protein
MSHEIRTPMNAIIGMTKIAESTDDIGKLRYCLATINASSIHLLGLINDILDMSKIEAGKFNLVNENFNIEETLIKVCNIITEKIEQKNIKLIVNFEKKMATAYSGDELRFYQVITNLLSNAVKFTQEGGKITISTSIVEHKADTSILRFSITDTGIGMTDEQMGRLFNAFEQADKTITQRFGGTGLGLAISKTIVEKMNGHISVSSHPGHGSTFTFDIELKRSDPADNPETAGQKKITSKPKLRVLLAEHDPDFINCFKDIVSSICEETLPEITVDIAETGEAVRKLAGEAFENGNPYDGLFLAYDIPGMDILSAAGKDSKKIDHAKIIIMASFLQWARIEKLAADMGISHFITKPIFPSRILKSIQGICNSEDTVKELQNTKNDIPDFSHINLLLVEDIEINREIFSAILESTNINIDTAENGRIALEKFCAAPEKYNIIIMDLQMPEMNGLDATKAIRALENESAKNVPIVAMTANVFKEDIEQCLAAGMNSHLKKPIEEKALLDAITKYAK